MDCDICGKKAKVHLTQLVGGQIKKIALCDACAKEKGVTDPTGFALAEMLLGKAQGKIPVPSAPVTQGIGRRCVDQACLQPPRDVGPDPCRVPCHALPPPLGRFFSRTSQTVDATALSDSGFFVSGP